MERAEVEQCRAWKGIDQDIDVTGVVVGAVHHGTDHTRIGRTEECGDSADVGPVGFQRYGGFRARAPAVAIGNLIGAAGAIKGKMRGGLALPARGPG